MTVNYYSGEPLLIQALNNSLSSSENGFRGAGGIEFSTMVSMILVPYAAAFS